MRAFPMPTHITVDCDDQSALMVAVLEMDRFQDPWWRTTLSDAAEILNSLYQPEVN